ncbi:hypothetical protein M3182_00560 [Mesobacillus maritimus]|uniref:hypothetical protein n=1 Tax=Mesobacillus maritimus TaxID=1643336 RepID=UPI00203D6D85|nr:hypothetical protein [Mesobacillus maritimus]MCM3584231.1 hypothetical protein [Mesobacillus maritimus]
MSIPEKHIVVKAVSEKYNCILSNIKRKQIMYEGTSNEKKLVLCTPQSKLHVNGKGWFDLTTLQIDLLDDSDIPILAVRLQGYKVYYIDFKELKKLMTPDIMLRNPKEGEHWKLYVWGNFIKVQGNEKEFHVQPELLDRKEFTLFI